MRSIRRHEHLARGAADGLGPEGQLDVELKRNLGSSTTSRHRVDANFTSYRHNPATTSIDFTVSCPMLPTYVDRASYDVAELFIRRATDKMHKHLAGCLEKGVAFLAGVHTTLGGVGPAPYLAYVRQIFSDAAALEILAGGRGQLAHHREHLFFASLHAIIARCMWATLERRLSASTGRVRGGLDDAPDDSPVDDQGSDGGADGGPA